MVATIIDEFTNIPEAWKRYYLRHRHELIEKSKDWDRKHRSIATASDRRYWKTIRKTITELLGSQCANPYGQHDKPYTDERALQIDHVNGGGRKAAKQFKNRYSYHLSIIKEIRAGSKDYQLLCANCNWIKKCENREDSHAYYEVYKDIKALDKQ